MDDQHPASIPPPDGRSPFIDAPLDVRMAIYGEVLRDAVAILDCGRVSHRWWLHSDAGGLELAATCSQIKDEIFTAIALQCPLTVECELSFSESPNSDPNLAPSRTNSGYESFRAIPSTSMRPAYGSLCVIMPNIRQIQINYLDIWLDWGTLLCERERVVISLGTEHVWQQDPIESWQQLTSDPLLRTRFKDEWGVFGDALSEPDFVNNNALHNLTTLRQNLNLLRRVDVKCMELVYQVFLPFPEKTVYNSNFIEIPKCVVMVQSPRCIYCSTANKLRKCSLMVRPMKSKANIIKSTTPFATQSEHRRDHGSRTSNRIFCRSTEWTTTTTNETTSIVAK
jgi:hypothetical protein